MTVAIGSTSVLALAVFIGLVLAVSAFVKLRAPGDFATAIIAYNIVPARLSRALATLLIVGEATAAIFLLSGLAVGSALGFGFGLSLVIFATYALVVWFNLVRGNIFIDCGCGWGSKARSRPVLTRFHALRPALLALTSLIGLAGLVQASAPAAPEVILAIAIGGTLLLLYIASDQLIENGSNFAGERA